MLSGDPRPGTHHRERRMVDTASLAYSRPDVAGKGDKSNYRQSGMAFVAWAAMPRTARVAPGGRVGAHKTQSPQDTDCADAVWKNWGELRQDLKAQTVRYFPRLAISTCVSYGPVLPSLPILRSESLCL